MKKPIKVSLEYQTWNRTAPKGLLQYAVGALLYCPADHEGIIKAICKNACKELNSIAFCLEDTIQDAYLSQAEETFLKHIGILYEAVEGGMISQGKLPLLFVRIRTPEQMLDMFHRLGRGQKLVTGFILPKFNSQNRESYQKAVLQMNQEASTIKYVMPTLESPEILKKETRQAELNNIKETLDSMKEYVLNIRIGGNDFSNVYGLRRKQNQSIYDMLVLQDVLADISSTFLEEYVISGPVWEYFEGDGTDAWKLGLQKETEQDKLNGFVGKTAIHPSQVSVIQQVYAVERGDYEDARAIVDWQEKTRAVAKSTQYFRMNERKVHQKWAEKVMALAHIYGIKDDRR